MVADGGEGWQVEERAGPQAEVGGEDRWQEGSRQGPETVAWSGEGLSWLRRGAGAGGASGPRKPEEVRGRDGLSSLQQGMGS